ncbi:hypothetical protein IFR05_000171 [Cadophora sp. M221]|nr:hypothetical protein IFR05_000171 [Cadophora sp. M221]
MCFYDQYAFACGDYRWGHFRQHCSKEYRTGETCGMKLVIETIHKSEICRLCQRIETKYAQQRKEEERIQRWTREGGKHWAAATAHTWNNVEKLQGEIVSLLQMRLSRMQTIDGGTAMEDIEDSEPEITAQPDTIMGDPFKSPSGNGPSNVGSPDLGASSTRVQSKAVEPVHTNTVARPEVPLRIFPIHAPKDAVLIDSWQNHALPNIKHSICTGDDSSISINLLRQGKTLEDSETIIRDQKSKPRSEDQQAEIVRSIKQLLIPLAAPRVLFVVGSIKRTARRSDLDLQPCAARNTAFLSRPPMGVSIGIEGSVKDTATLGGYVYIDEIPHILTVHHLFVDDETARVYEAGTAITQPSLQEVKEFSELWDRIKSKSTGESFHLDCVRKAFDDLKACLPEFSFGNLTISSGYRNRSSRDGPSNVEMDWALCRVKDRRVGSNMSLWSPRSGPFYDQLQNWVTTGIGVSGDSGAWIVEHGTDSLVGQLWGRDFHERSSGDDGEIITYFTPILDIFDDIREFTGAAEISISMKEESDPGDDKDRNRMVSSSQILPFQPLASLGEAVTDTQTVNSGISTGFLQEFKKDAPDCEGCNSAAVDCRCLKACELNILAKRTESGTVCEICRKSMSVRDGSIEASRDRVAHIESEILQLKTERENKQMSLR